MKITQPAANASFTITAAPDWPSIPFQTDQKGAHTWTWRLTWKTFSKSGTVTTSGNTWEAKPAVQDAGGSLAVTVKAGTATASVTVKIVGTNPGSAAVTTYLATKPNSAGFDKIVQKESKGNNFTAAGEPIRSFDGGYGLCQLTTPAPTFEQCWNWKRNVDGGLALFAVKVMAATTYLAQSQRTYTTDQLTREAVCRWNGGSYHEWDTKTSAWIRKPNILCDTATGNIGWDMTDAANTGQTEAQLRARDKGSYSAPPASGAHWKYSGVCYADRMVDG